MQEGAADPTRPELTPQGGNELLAQVYDQLRAIAQRRLEQESPGHTLQATALVHEAYLKLCSRESVLALDKNRFVMAAAEAMRRILIDHARARARVKRGGPNLKKAITNISDVADLAADRDPEEIVALDEAIRRLEQEEPQAVQVVKLRFYAGLSVEEAAEALGVSPRTVKRDWQYARAWLFRALK